MLYFFECYIFEQEDTLYKNNKNYIPNKLIIVKTQE